jgi:hypothetical protein
VDESLKLTFINHWKQYFDGAPLPIAYFFTDDLHNAEPALKVAGHQCIIGDLARVFRGESLAFNSSNIGCGGGLRYCGFTDKLAPGAEFFLSYGIPGKMKGERYKKDPTTVLELLKNVPIMKAPASWLVAKPFDKLEPDDQPEAIVFFSTVDTIAGLFTLANYDSTDLYGVKTPFSAGCGSIIQHPYLENQRDHPDCILGMFDSSARPHVPDGVLSFAIPMKRFVQLVGYMDESFLITETWDFLRHRISTKSQDLTR